MSDGFGNGLLKGLAHQVGIAGLEFDENGRCVLAFDEIVVSFEADPESHQLFLSASVGEAPHGLPEELYRQVLEANLLWHGTGGATLSLDDRSRRFMLVHAVPVDRVSEVQFVEIVGTFVDIAETWRTRIAEAHHAPSADAAMVTDPGKATLFV